MPLTIDITAGSVRALAVPATTVPVTVIQGPVFLCGWSLRESTGAAPAAGDILDVGNNIGEFGMGSGGESTHSFGSQGIMVNGELIVSPVVGSVVGCLYVGFADQTGE